MPKFFVIFVQKWWSESQTRWKQSFYMKTFSYDRHFVNVLNKINFFGGSILGQFKGYIFSSFVRS